MATVVTPNLNDAVTAAQTFSTQAATSATAAAAAATTASAGVLAVVKGVVEGPLSADPVTRPIDGSPLQQGDIYFNTSANVLKMYVNTSWVPVALSTSVAGLVAGNNLSDLQSVSTARFNLGLGSAALSSTSAFLQPANNLSDLNSAATARTNLGLATIATSGSASDLGAGTLPAGRLPNPSASTLGGVQSATAPTHNFQTGINTSGVPTFAQPGFADVTGLGTAAAHPATDFLQPANNLSDVSSPGAALANIGGVGSLVFFGDAADGNVTVTTSISLTRDMYYNNLTIQAGAAIATHGYRIYVKGTLDISAAPTGAFINNAAANSGGSGVQGAAGGNGGTGGSSANGAAAAAISHANGGSGGTGGNGSAGTYVGGAGGATSRAGFVVGALGQIGYDSSQGAGLPFLGGGGGGGGGAGSSSGIGGNGGGGGGAIIIIANAIARGTNTNTSIIQATGAAGGTTAAQPGGGGGGGGGWVFIVYATLSGSGIANAVDISGGGGGSSASGSGGNAGSSGGYWTLTIGGTLTQIFPVAGAAGSGVTGAAANTQRYTL